MPLLEQAQKASQNEEERRFDEIEGKVLTLLAHYYGNCENGEILDAIHFNNFGDAIEKLERMHNEIG
jgi:hypothetical protein